MVAQLYTFTKNYKYFIIYKLYFDVAILKN
jgi:hypothetical protein